MRKLEDDARYLQARNRLTQLQTALTSLESERDGLQGRLNQLAHEPQKSKMDEAADSLIANGEISVGSLDLLRQSMTQLTDKIAIHRVAIDRQRKHIAELVSEISKTIAQEMLPEHKANVRKIVKCLLALDAALIREHELRDQLFVDGVQYSGVIRVMPIPRLGTTRDRHSMMTAYLLECLQHEFISKAELPERLHKFIPSRGHGVQERESVASDSDGWLMAVN